MKANITEYIGLILWQEDRKEELLNDINNHCSNHPFLVLKEIFDLPLNKFSERTEFLRLVYPDEHIPDDNPKIQSKAPICVIIIEDLFPVYGEIITGSGKSVIANTNGIELKVKMREKVHWKYIHSTDNFKEYCYLIQLIKEKVNSIEIQELVGKYFPFKKIKINLENLSYFDKDGRTTLANSSHYKYVKEYINNNNKSPENNSYEKYLNNQIGLIGTNYDHNIDKFNNLIDTFDYRNYNNSPYYNLISLTGFTAIPDQYKFLVNKSSLSYLFNKSLNYSIDLENFSLVDTFYNLDCLYYEDFEKHFIINDGLHRASILLYRNIKYIEAILYPVNLEINLLFETLRNTNFTNFFNVHEKVKNGKIDHPLEQLKSQNFHNQYANPFR